MIQFMKKFRNLIPWSGQDYAEHSSGQFKAAMALLEHIDPLKDNEVVLDVGCGNGKITRMIAQKLSKGRIVGIDSSKSMIEAANEEWKKKAGDYPNLSFEVQDAQNMSFENEFDRVLSFTALHWVKDQNAAIACIRKALKPSGKFAMTMVRGFYPPFQQASDELIKDDKWRQYFFNFSSGYNFLNREAYLKLLRENAFESPRVQAVFQYLLYPSREAFRDYVKQWYAYATAVPDRLRDAFMNDLIDRYLKLQPIDYDGQVLFIIEHLQAEAIKSETAAADK